MTIKYTVTEDDLLQNQLYAASHSTTISTRRQYMRWVLAIAYFIIGLFAIQNGDWIFGCSVSIVGVLWYLFYPLYTRKRHINHFKKFIRENQSNLVGQEIELTIGDDAIFAKDISTESKINMSAIIKLAELKENMVISLQGSAIIIPKKHIGNLEHMKQIFHLKGIPFVDDSKWEWK